jgi:hypothetical protein
MGLHAYLRSKYVSTRLGEEIAPCNNPSFPLWTTNPIVFGLHSLGCLAGYIANSSSIGIAYSLNSRISFGDVDMLEVRIWPWRKMGEQRRRRASRLWTEGVALGGERMPRLCGHWGVE